MTKAEQRRIALGAVEQLDTWDAVLTRLSPLETCYEYWTIYTAPSLI